MKRLLTIVMLGLLIFSVGCSNTSGKADYKSLYNSQTKQLLSLGDTKEVLEEKIGESITITDENRNEAYDYLDNTLQISYNSDGKAFSIKSSSQKLLADGYAPTAPLKEKEFTVSLDYENTIVYSRWYDSNGKQLKDETNAAYYLDIYVTNGTFEAVELYSLDF